MTADVNDDTIHDTDLAGDTVALVRRWLREAADIPASVAARRLAGVLSDPNGLEFTTGFVDGVVRPEDVRVAAAALRRVAPKVPAFLPAPLRGAVRLGGAVGPVAPGIVVPIARTVLRRMVGHLIADARDDKLGGAIRALKRDGVRLNINLLGEAVLGAAEAQRRRDGTLRLLQREDVDYVSVKVSSMVGPHSPWGFDEAVETIVERLLPLYRQAATAATSKFINLDMEEYRDLDLTMAVFMKLLDRPEFETLEAGIVLQAYLPDAMDAMVELQEWAATRRANGGAPVKVRLVKGANLSMEKVDAEVHGWPLATWHTKQDSDTHYKRILDWSLQPERVANVRLGIAGHNLFDIAHSWLLAQQRGVTGAVEYEMLLGMAESLAEVVRREVGSLLLYTPVVRPEEFDVAIAYLIRRLEEGASSENFMSAVFELDSNPALLQRETDRFVASLAEVDAAAAHTHRVQDRTAEPAPGLTSGFGNTPDTDPAIGVNREWGRAILERVPDSVLGITTADAAILPDEAAVHAALERAQGAAAAWQELGPDGRAQILHRAGDALERRRAQLLEVMASEAGKTLDQGDPEVSEAIDFAHYYAERARELPGIDGATYTPADVTLVTPPWNFPVAIPAGSTLSALASGSTVVIKPARQARRCGAVMVEALWEAGVPREVLQLVQLADSALGEKLVASPLVDQVILTGGYETAEMFRGFRSDLRLLGETSGKNAIIVTPSADLDLAAKDVVYSAFGHAGQKCSAASLVILVGSVAKSRRFHDQLLDAVRSLHVALPTDPTAEVGPVIAPPTGKLREALTSLGEGETWVIEPRQLPEDERLWTPGVRAGVRRGSEYHLIEYFGPILGVMTAATLDEAIAIQNEISYGLTAGIHALDAGEIRTWLAGIQAGNLYVNRGITGAIVQRQPFGGWKKSVVGAGFKAGGPNYLIGLGRWADAPVTGAAADDASPAGGVVTAASASLTGDERDWLTQAVATDAAAWRDEFAAPRDRSGLTAERNVFRYLPVDADIRAEKDATIAEISRVVAAAVRTGSRVHLSVATPLPETLASAVRDAGIDVVVEDAPTAYARYIAQPWPRVRLIGASGVELIRAAGGRPDLTVFDGAVTRAGRVELLPFLREQAVSITAHRFGNPDPLAHAVL
ncbi:bifunctional proline dehydrogenase/L-glutamate gamma-semialdehyde dehydrogenase [Microbacterium invictum]|uniref:L-glutamate gamma-semialdehyde dehydrogenase n=1 Tax=Microbacterium invictum TaxID=515415 RepID=A0AA40VNI0_9MICO|nr:MULTISPECIES: bifunctional proline dehydrogenase/L-glutamate gamma-semialdehyde dehydrogenase [Microbacterium]MBB4140463.1 RHH-type proline utilization regulon transcriptional repressor/proline dehydrogenase/delta 1-pyrroline-5-carboxylate dehydrogenase [Microbacterium invictum]